jgi:hypothetical protein
VCPVAPGDGRRVSMPRDACWEQRAEPCLNDTSPPSWFEWSFTYVFLSVLLYNTYEIARGHSVCIFPKMWGHSCTAGSYVADVADVDTHRLQKTPYI